MKYYEQIVDKKILSLKKICNIVGNKNSAKVVISKYMKNGSWQGKTNSICSNKFRN